jgi:predicted enzyme related to lactoylglutathione lyase
MYYISSIGGTTMLNLNSLLLFSEDPKKLSSFYEKIFGKKPEWQEMGYFGFKVGDGYLTIGPHEKIKGINKEPERQMMNFETTEVKAEFDRIEKTGAKVIAKPYNPMEKGDGLLATFEDIDGNYFQIISPIKEMM